MVALLCKAQVVKYEDQGTLLDTATKRVRKAVAKHACGWNRAESGRWGVIVLVIGWNWEISNERICARVEKRLFTI